VAETVIERIIQALKDVADRVNAYQFGRMQVEWQDGRPVLVEVTTKHKPKREE